MSKQGILIGGTFNPFTKAHQAMAVTVHKWYPEADIIYVPSNMEYISGWKELPEGEVFSGKNRVELIKEAVADIPNCFVSDIESTGAVDGRSYHTVRYYKEYYDEIYLCIGSDKLSELEHWYRAEELMQEVNVLLFTRGARLSEETSGFIGKFRERIREISFEYPGVSSSLIRKLYAEGKMEELKQYVPDAVYRYLQSQKEGMV